ncbi:hypothetical protein MKEN_00809900 [Mycena kentingensis (nom. inval.)]|nr:hypothetical protein MKEN_00809900 [Mycena kentingensis (nom. inval.)]
MSEIDQIFTNKKKRAAAVHESLPSHKKRKLDTKKQPEAKKPKQRPQKEDLDRFKDSRGTGPRRKTEEGFSIYKEDELGINDEGGDTPLCPFDCDCCF